MEQKNNNTDKSTLKILKKHKADVLIQLELNLLDAIDLGKMYKSKQNEIYNVARNMLFLKYLGVFDEDDVEEFFTFFIDNV